MRIRLAQSDTGFTAVELLITLFVAATFLAAGYQLFNLVITDGGNTRAEASASNIAYDYLRRYSDSATNPCSTVTPLSNQSVEIEGLVNPSVTVAITCAQPDAPSVSRIEVSITYGLGVEENTVKHATYVDKSKGASPVVDVTNGLVARWLMNGNTNTDVGTSNGTISGGVTPTTNRSGTANQAYAFNGSTGYINIPYSSATDLGAAFTISAWVNPSTLASRYGVFSTRTNNANGSWQLEIGTGNGGTNRVSVTGVGTWVFDSVNNVITTGNWQHIVYVMPNAGSSSGTMYINNASVGSSATTPSYAITNNSDPLRIGQGTSASQFFAGSIDDVRLYNRALSASEVSQLYNGGPK